MLPLFIKPMEVLSLGENLATNLGLHVRKTKIGLYILALVFAAIGVLLVGGLSFIGLIAPHIARELAGFKLKKSSGDDPFDEYDYSGFCRYHFTNYYCAV